MRSPTTNDHIMMLEVGSVNYLQIILMFGYAVRETGHMLLKRFLEYINA